MENIAWVIIRGLALMVMAQLAIAGEYIFSVPIREINPNWCSASVFAGTPNHNKSYSLLINHQGVNNVVVSVGSYTACDNKHGTFLLALNVPSEDISEAGPSSRKRHIHKIHVLQEFENEFKPTLMKLPGDDFLLFDCGDCNEAVHYKLDGYPPKFVVEEKLGERQLADKAPPISKAQNPSLSELGICEDYNSGVYLRGAPGISGCLLYFTNFNSDYRETEAVVMLNGALVTLYSDPSVGEAGYRYPHIFHSADNSVSVKLNARAVNPCSGEFCDGESYEGTITVNTALGKKIYKIEFYRGS